MGQTQSEFRFPVDQRSIRDRISGGSADLNVQPEVLVTRVTEVLPPTERVVEVTDDGIEIIETGIEIVEPASPTVDDGIVFLD